MMQEVVLKLANGKIIIAHESKLLSAISAAVIKALKELSKLPKDIHLIPEKSLRNMFTKMESMLGMILTSLDLEKTLIILGISTMLNPTIDIALDRLIELKGCEMYMTHSLTPDDERILEKLGINYTCDSKSPLAKYLK